MSGKVIVHWQRTSITTIVKHSASQYLYYADYSNNFENFWLILKRGINDTYRQVSYKHLPGLFG